MEDPAATSSNGGKWYAFPSIAVSSADDVLLGFSQFGSTMFPAAGYTFRAGGDAAGSMREVAIAKAGEGFSYKTYGGGRNRCGDFSATQVDPSDDSLWTIQQYTKPPVGTGDEIGPVEHVVGEDQTGARRVHRRSAIGLDVDRIKAVHITELRTRIDAVRAAKGLKPFTWTDSSLSPASTVVRVIHVVELRTALADAYNAAKLTPPAYTDPALSAGATVRAVHITELRAAVVAIE